MYGIAGELYRLDCDGILSAATGDNHRLDLLSIHLVCCLDHITNYVTVGPVSRTAGILIQSVKGASCL